MILKHERGPEKFLDKMYTVFIRVLSNPGKFHRYLYLSFLILLKRTQTKKFNNCTLCNLYFLKISKLLRITNGNKTLEFKKGKIGLSFEILKTCNSVIVKHLPLKQLYIL